MTAQHILVVDADPETAHLISCTLEQPGYALEIVPNCAAALAAMWCFQPQLVISNATSAGADGIDLKNALRPYGLTILLLTMRDVLYNRAAILERTRLLLERASFGGPARHVVDRLSTPLTWINAPTGLSRPPLFTLGLRATEAFTIAVTPVFALENGDADVCVNGHAAHLTPTEFSIFTQLIAANGAYVTYDALLQRVWGAPYQGARHLLQVHLQRLRLKLEQAGAPRDIIRNRSRVGYTVDAALSEGWRAATLRQLVG